MFRLHDARTAETVPVQPATPGLLVVEVADGSGDPDGPDALRALVVTDLVRRVAERHNLRVTAGTGAPGPGLAAVRSALNVHPVEHRTPGGQPDVVLRVGQVGIGTSGDVSPAALAAGGADPLALRLVLLASHYRRPLVLTKTALAAGEADLRGWRQATAEWAHSPGRPMCAARVADFLAALDDDLGAPAALAVLREVADDPGLPPGAKFEMFAYFDRLLGLDLAREVGQ